MKLIVFDESLGLSFWGGFRGVGGWEVWLGVEVFCCFVNFFFFFFLAYNQDNFDCKKFYSQSG